MVVDQVLDFTFSEEHRGKIDKLVRTGVEMTVESAKHLGRSMLYNRALFLETELSKAIMKPVESYQEEKNRSFGSTETKKSSSQIKIELRSLERHKQNLIDLLKRVEVKRNEGKGWGTNERVFGDKKKCKNYGSIRSHFVECETEIFGPNLSNFSNFSNSSALQTAISSITRVTGSSLNTIGNVLGLTEKDIHSIKENLDFHHIKLVNKCLIDNHIGRGHVRGTSGNSNHGDVGRWLDGNKMLIGGVTEYREFCVNGIHMGNEVKHEVLKAWSKERGDIGPKEIGEDIANDPVNAWLEDDNQNKQNENKMEDDNQKKQNEKKRRIANSDGNSSSSSFSANPLLVTRSSQKSIDKRPGYMTEVLFSSEQTLCAAYERHRLWKREFEFLWGNDFTSRKNITIGLYTNTKASPYPFGCGYNKHDYEKILEMIRFYFKTREFKDVIILESKVTEFNPGSHRVQSDNIDVHSNYDYNMAFNEDVKRRLKAMEGKKPYRESDNGNVHSSYHPSPDSARNFHDPDSLATTPRIPSLAKGNVDSAFTTPTKADFISREQTGQEQIGGSSSSTARNGSPSSKQIEPSPTSPGSAMLGPTYGASPMTQTEFLPTATRDRTRNPSPSASAATTPRKRGKFSNLAKATMCDVIVVLTYFGWQELADILWTKRNKANNLKKSCSLPFIICAVGDMRHYQEHGREERFERAEKKRRQYDNDDYRGRSDDLFEGEDRIASKETNSTRSTNANAKNPVSLTSNIGGDCEKQVDQVFGHLYYHDLRDQETAATGGDQETAATGGDPGPTTGPAASDAEDNKVAPSSPKSPRKCGGCCRKKDFSKNRERRAHKYVNPLTRIQRTDLTEYYFPIVYLRAGFLITELRTDCRMRGVAARATLRNTERRKVDAKEEMKAMMIKHRRKKLERDEELQNIQHRNRARKKWGSSLSMKTTHYRHDLYDEYHDEYQGSGDGIGRSSSEHRGSGSPGERNANISALQYDAIMNAPILSTSSDHDSSSEPEDDDDHDVDHNPFAGGSPAVGMQGDDENDGQDGADDNDEDGGNDEKRGAGCVKKSENRKGIEGTLQNASSSSLLGYDGDDLPPTKSKENSRTNPPGQNSPSGISDAEKSDREVLVAQSLLLRGAGASSSKDPECSGLRRRRGYPSQQLSDRGRRIVEDERERADDEMRKKNVRSRNLHGVTLSDDSDQPITPRKSTPPASPWSCNRRGDKRGSPWSAACRRRKDEEEANSNVQKKIKGNKKKKTRKKSSSKGSSWDSRGSQECRKYDNYDNRESGQGGKMELLGKNGDSTLDLDKFKTRKKNRNSLNPVVHWISMEDFLDILFFLVANHFTTKATSKVRRRDYNNRSNYYKRSDAVYYLNCCSQHAEKYDDSIEYQLLGENDAHKAEYLTIYRKETIQASELLWGKDESKTYVKPDQVLTHIAKNIASSVATGLIEATPLNSILPTRVTEYLTQDVVPTFTTIGIRALEHSATPDFSNLVANAVASVANHLPLENPTEKHVRLTRANKSINNSGVKNSSKMIPSGMQSKDSGYNDIPFNSIASANMSGNTLNTEVSLSTPQSRDSKTFSTNLQPKIRGTIFETPDIISEIKPNGSLNDENDTLNVHNADGETGQNDVEQFSSPTLHQNGASTSSINIPRGIFNTPNDDIVSLPYLDNVVSPHHLYDEEDDPLSRTELGVSPVSSDHVNIQKWLHPDHVLIPGDRGIHPRLQAYVLNTNIKPQQLIETGYVFYDYDINGDE